MSTNPSVPRRLTVKKYNWSIGEGYRRNAPSALHVCSAWSMRSGIRRARLNRNTSDFVHCWVVWPYVALGQNNSSWLIVLNRICNALTTTNRSNAPMNTTILRAIWWDRRKPTMKMEENWSKQWNVDGNAQSSMSFKILMRINGDFWKSSS